MMTTSPLMDPCTPVSMPTGSTHVCTHRVRTHTCTHWAHARTHALGPCMHACTGPVHTCSHWVPMPARSWGPCMLARTGSPCLLAPGPRTHFISMHTCTGSRSPCPLTHGAHACTHVHTGSSCPFAHRVPTHARTGPCVHAHSRSPCLLA